MKRWNGWHMQVKRVISNLSYISKNNLPTTRPAFKPDASSCTVTSPHLISSATQWDKRCVRERVVTRCGAEAPLLLFPVAIRPVFHKPGHDLLMHVFKKFMNWSGPERRWSCSNHSSLVLSSEHTGRRERAWCRRLRGGCSKQRYRWFKKNF